MQRVGFPDTETFSATYTTLCATLDGLLGEHGVEWAQTVLGGFSQGAVMSYAVGLGAGRPAPAAVLAMSGFIPQVAGWQADLAGREGYPVAIAHGTLDPVISVEFARDARRRLQAASADVLYRESAMAHTIDPRVVPELQSWVAARFS